MNQLESIAEKAHITFEARTQARDQALLQARLLTRQSAYAIRAIHREEEVTANEHLAEAQKLVETLKVNLAGYPDLYYAGYTQDAIKEYAEARLTCAMILDQTLPLPEDLGMEYATYLNGLAEANGELRRRSLDLLRRGRPGEAERLLVCMDDIYTILVTMDYPDAITNGLRRQTDLVRSILERTRGDLTISLREEALKQRLEHLAALLPPQDGSSPIPTDVDADHPGI
jgi:translin